MSPQTPLDTESGRGRAVSDELGPTPDAGSVGARCRAHVPEQPGQTHAKEREVTSTDARFRHSAIEPLVCRKPEAALARRVQGCGPPISGQETHDIRANPGSSEGAWSGVGL